MAAVLNDLEVLIARTGLSREQIFAAMPVVTAFFEARDKMTPPETTITPMQASADAEWAAWARGEVPAHRK
jgi:hypothetical protein